MEDQGSTQFIIIPLPLELILNYLKNIAMILSEKIIEDYIFQRLASPTSAEIDQQIKTNKDLKEQIESTHLALVDNYLDQQLTEDQLRAFEALLSHDETTQSLLFNQKEIKNAMTFHQSQLAEKEASIKIKKVLSETIQETELNWDELRNKTPLQPIVSNKEKSKSILKWRKMMTWGLVAASVTAFFFLFSPFSSQNTSPTTAYLKQIQLPTSVPELKFKQQEEQVSSTTVNQDLESKIRTLYKDQDFSSIIPLCDQLIKTGSAKQQDYGIFVKSAVYCQKYQFEKAIVQLESLRLPQDSEIFIASKYFLALAHLKKEKEDLEKGSTLLNEIIQTCLLYTSPSPRD